MQLSAALAADARRNPAQPVAMYEFVLEAARQPALRDEVARWEEAHLRLAEAGLRAVGSADPETDAHIVVAVVSGTDARAARQPEPGLRARRDAPDARAPVHAARSRLNSVRRYAVTPLTPYGELRGDYGLLP